ncbi:MAG: hypothetical protein LKG79_11630 [Furfurilactobacillus sp.]|uniref:Type II secretion system protein n=1 Tax=Furfurilactobacillus milii TaxID=2888272 RepID=A0ABT6DFP4_9LACO|nr:MULTISPECIES: hypothetical protein [Furfurilactobacillus]MCF6161985.1 hypothetical protein [Furfurilactobacillus milii]MCF6164365.1 hypothetical protein [Furfurilactobacillus milii]MCF6420578.1 hypothetical protein [Furfurilactobacillus milii]MCH4011083.1 hypothetical protein [Furfurilactobacillus sp.]MCH4036975.1 hypothetical protein [Furfurilactobacillus sp.]
MKSSNVSQRAGFVMVEAMLALALALSACTLVMGVTQQMNTRLTFERQRTKKARLRYEKTSRQLGEVMNGKREVKASVHNS